MLIAVSGFFVSFGVYLLFGCIAAVVLFYFGLRNRRFRHLIDGLILKIPIFGRLVQSYHVANFCRTLGLLLKSQVLVVEATRIAGRMTNNLVYKKKIEEVSHNVTRGEMISVHLARNKHLFPPICTQMISVGEATGGLSDTLLFVSELYENEVDMLTKNLSTMLEPALMIVMGTVVGFIAVSIITPIYELTQHINP